MIKSVLVSLTGCDSDEVALETALLAGGPFRAHFDCLHARPGPQELSFGKRTNDFAGMLTSDLLDLMQERDRVRSVGARMAFDLFRKRLNIPLAEKAGSPDVTAAWQQSFGNPVAQTIAAARYHDLTVFGRTRDFTPLSRDAIGQIVIACGKPVLIAPENAPSRLGHVIAIAWNACAQVARTMTAAAPLIPRAMKIFILTAVEGKSDRDWARNSADTLAGQLRRLGVKTETRIVDAGNNAADVVFETARTVDADLVLSGAYGHNRVHEIAFGGFTESALRRAPLPVLMFH